MVLDTTPERCLAQVVAYRASGFFGAMVNAIGLAHPTLLIRTYAKLWSE
jgi:hypothetical protein